jgi:two-component system OmpR family sensor kinase
VRRGRGEWRDLHARMHDHHTVARLRRHRWRGHWRLQRQLFMSFGFAIVVAMMVSAWVSAALPAAISGRPFGRLLMFLACGVLMWGLAGMWARRLSRPLRELSRVAGELGGGKLESRVRLPRHGAGELRELAEAFNDMTARLEALVKSKTELLHAVSHELRTPLARLRVLLGILAEQNREPKLALDLEREVLELDALVGELLAGARIDAGALSPRTLDVRETVETCVTRSGLTQVHVEIGHDAARVHGDPTLLARALLVLLDNAKKHGGTRVTLRVERAAEQLRFSVEDDGQGFEAADLPRLFTPFARGRGQLPDEARGLGLGLYLVRRIAEAHAGEAFAHNAAERGAVVGFSVSHAASAQQRGNGGAGTVLAS